MSKNKFRKNNYLKIKRLLLKIFGHLEKLKTRLVFLRPETCYCNSNSIPNSNWLCHEEPDLKFEFVSNI